MKIILKIIIFILISQSSGFSKDYEVKKDFYDKAYSDLDYDCLQKRNKAKLWSNFPINYYHANIWNWRNIKNFEDGKTIGICIKKRKRPGWYWTASKVSVNNKNEVTSWAQPTYQIGKSPWNRDLDYKETKDFPIHIKKIRSLNFAYNYVSLGEGYYNHNLTLWLKNNKSKKKVDYEIMLKFNGPQVDQYLREPYCNKLGKGSKTLNDLILEKMGFKVCHKTSERNLFESDGSIEWDTIIFYPQNLKNKNGEFDIEIEIKNIFNYLIQENILSEELILPGLELNTEIWYGKEDLEIKSLSYTLLKN
jgi:hypothetical protein